MPREHWVEAPLSQLLESLESGSRPKGGVKGITEGVPSIGAEHLAADGGFNFENIRFVPDKFANSMNRGQIKHLDILVVKDGATTGKTSFVRETFPFPKACVNEHVYICRAFKVTSKEFLFHYLKSHEGQEYIMSTFHGAAQGGISSGFADVVIVPLPPLPEQKRIVEKLDSILPKVKSIKARLDKIPRILKRFRQSILSSAYSGKLTEDWRGENRNAPEWQETELENLIIDGPQNGLYKHKDFYGEGVLIVRIDNIYDGFISEWGTLKRLRVTEKELNANKLENDDFLINRVNSIEFLGKSALVRHIKENCVFESNMMRFKVDAKVVLPEYLIKYLNSEYGLKELRKNAKDAVNQSSINQEDVKSVIVPYPSLEEQHEIVRRVEKLFKLADSLEAKYAKAIERVRKIEQSVLAKAFRGELAPQDPNDEPAEKLLKRILAEKAIPSIAHKGRRRAKLQTHRKKSPRSPR